MARRGKVLGFRVHYWFTEIMSVFAVGPNDL